MAVPGIADLYVALCPSLNVSSFGESIDEAKKALVEAVEIFIEECSEMGTLDEVLEESGFTRKDQGCVIVVGEHHADIYAYSGGCSFAFCR